MTITDLKRGKSRVIGTGLGAAFLLVATAAPAANIIVDSAADTMQDGAPCTLREAIISANTNPVVATNGCIAGEAAALDTISFSVNGPIVLTGNELATGAMLSGDLAITGPMTIDANNASRIFNNTAALTLTDMTLINGTVTGAGASGGAILNDAGGVLTVTGGAMNNNTSVRAGGAIEVAPGTAGTTSVTLNNVNFSGNDAGTGPGNGGVLHISGDATSATNVAVTGGIFDSNTAIEGGALWNGPGTMTVTGSTFTNNAANGALISQGGGGLFNQGGTLNITGATITGNSATGSAATPPVMGSGGGILNNGGTLSVTDSTISSNSSVRAGGGIEDDSREIASVLVTLTNVTMNANTTGGSPGNGGAVHISGAGTMDVVGGSFTNNVAANEGGGLWNFGTATMTIDGATITGNQGNGTDPANGGGGLFNNGGTMNVSNALINGNSATQGSGSGGGILNGAAGTLTVTSSEISGNTANRAGGGVETGSPTTSGSSVSLNDVFLNGNTVNTSPGNGGGLHAGGDANVDVTNSIVSNNNAGLEGGGLWVDNGNLNVSASRITQNNGTGDRVNADATNTNADGGGGGIVINGTGTANITANTLIAQNTANGSAGSGGGIFAKPGSTVNVTDSVIASNSAQRAGGGIENDGGSVNLLRVTLGGANTATGNLVNGTPANGGGLHTGGAGTVVVDDSSIGYNTASEGGGLWNSGAGSMMVNNTTLSNNQATDRTGGGIHQDGDGGTLDVNFATVAFNSAAGNGGGIAVPGASTATVDSSIVSDNTSGSTDANVSNVTPTSSVVGSNVGLDNYRLFGGTTATHPLLVGSAAIDSGDAVNCAVAPIDSADQRAATRPAACDAGAFEAAGNPVVTVTNNNQSIVNVPTSGQTGVTVLAFTLNNSSSGSVTIDGVSGVVDASVPGIDPSNFQVFANGSQTPINGATVTVDGRSFTVSFNAGNGLVFNSGQSASYTVTADFTTSTMATANLAAPAFAGGLLLSLLGLFSVGGIRRRTQLALLALTMVVGLSACGGGGSGGGNALNNNNNDAPAPADLRFIAVTVDGDAGAGNDFIVGDGMPVNGPGINFGS